jgi:hypothetical protein
MLQVAAAAGKRRWRQEQNPHSEKDQHQIESERLWRTVHDMTYDGGTALVFFARPGKRKSCVALCVKIV